MFRMGLHAAVPDVVRAAPSCSGYSVCAKCSLAGTPLGSLLLHRLRGLACCAGGHAFGPVAEGQNIGAQEQVSGCAGQHHAGAAGGGAGPAGAAKCVFSVPSAGSSHATWQAVCCRKTWMVHILGPARLHSDGMLELSVIVLLHTLLHNGIPMHVCSMRSPWYVCPGMDTESDALLLSHRRLHWGRKVSSR